MKSIVFLSFVAIALPIFAAPPPGCPRGNDRGDKLGINCSYEQSYYSNYKYSDTNSNPEAEIEEGQDWDQKDTEYEFEAHDTRICDPDIEFEHCEGVGKSETKNGEKRGNDLKKCPHECQPRHQCYCPWWMISCPCAKLPQPHCPKHCGKPHQCEVSECTEERPKDATGGNVAKEPNAETILNEDLKESKQSSSPTKRWIPEILNTTKAAFSTTVLTKAGTITTNETETGTTVNADL